MNRPYYLLFGLLLASGLLATGPLQAQNLKFGTSFARTGELIGESREFHFNAPQLILAVKFEARGELPLDTLYVIVKDLDGVAGRFYMKRNKDHTEANALIRLRKDGIYRVYIYNPSKRARPIRKARIFVTSSSVPTRAALIERQRQLLVQRGLLQDPNANIDIAQADSTAVADDDPFADLDDDLPGLDDDLFGSDDFGDDDLENFELDLDLGFGDDILSEEDLQGDFESYDDLDDELDFDIDEF